MFNKEKLKEVVKLYKEQFPQWWIDEKFKWQAIKYFRDNWDIDAVDLSEMIDRALDNSDVYYGLFTSVNRFPVKMIKGFAGKDPETVRQMFVDLFDESKDVYYRIEQFKIKANELNERFSEKGKNHYQDENCITTYLWLRYPEKYYIYKYSEVKEVASVLESGYKFKKGEYEYNVRNSIKFYDEICEELSNDEELVDMLHNVIDDSCDKDIALKTLTFDVGFYISRKWGEQTMEKVNSAWFVGAVIGNVNMFDTFIAEGRWENGYNDKYIDKVKSMHPGDKIAIKSAYTRKNVPFETNGKNLSVMSIKAIGTITKNHDDGRNIDVKWDKVFNPFKEWFFFTMRNVLWYVERQEESWEYGALIDFAFSDVEQDYARFLSVPYWNEKYAKVQEEEEVVSGRETNIDKNTILYGPPGTGKTYITARYAVAIIENKTLCEVENIPNEEIRIRYNRYITQGRIEFTTFHQSYGYEEFIEGIKPVVNVDGNVEYKVEDGLFKKFCTISEKEANKGNYVFIVDEINRGNISKIFGELITLIESTKRVGLEEELKAKLPYSQSDFGVPKNVYIIGTMNTADRSIAAIDTALRRRFAFKEMMPDTDVINEVDIEGVNVADLLNIINKRIEVLYDREHTIGHAYFTSLIDNPSKELLFDIFRNKIFPLLQEYFFEDYEKIQLVLGDNQKTDDSLKFIKENKVYYKDLFGSYSFDYDDKKTYEINDSAFNNIETYKAMLNGTIK